MVLYMTVVLARCVVHGVGTFIAASVSIVLLGTTIGGLIRTVTAPIAAPGHTALQDRTRALRAQARGNMRRPAARPVVCVLRGGIVHRRPRSSRAQQVHTEAALGLQTHWSARHVRLTSTPTVYLAQ